MKLGGRPVASLVDISLGFHPQHHKKKQNKNTPNFLPMKSSTETPRQLHGTVFETEAQGGGVGTNNQSKTRTQDMWPKGPVPPTTAVS